MIDFFAWIVLITIIFSGVAVFVALGLWPGHVAKQRLHPYVDAISIGSWVLLILGGVLWPLILIWSYSTPKNNKHISTEINKEELLFRIDPAPYQAAFDDAEASVKLANIRLAQEQTLLENNVGKQFNLDRALAQVAQSQARLELAKFNLKSTNVFAPSQGYATNIALRPGTRVVAFPFAPSLSFVDTSERIVGGFVLQNHLRYIEQGQKVEVALKMYPGQVFEAIVDSVVPARATGLETITGLPVVPQELQHAPFAVKVKLSAEMDALNLPAGASGRMVIYSGEGGFAHIIRKVEIRIESIINYINPF